jgi:hypothetical protein
MFREHRPEKSENADAKQKTQQDGAIMLSISNRTALCLTGIALSGCMQSMPTAESLTKPTVEAFARLSSWTPWKPTPEQAPPLVIADTPPARQEVVAVPLSEPAIQLKELRRPVERRRPQQTARLSTARTVPVSAGPVRATVPQESAPLLPAKVSCQTTNQPGERVRMECKAVE